jgi:membrane protease YdiL (CAAX protease family)
MNDESESLPPVVTLVDEATLAEPAPPKRKGWALLSWVVILGAVGVLVALRVVSGAQAEGERPAGMARLDLKVLRWQLQSIIALHQLSRDMDPREAYEQVKDLGEGDPAKELRLSIFAREMMNTLEARKHLARIKHDAANQDDRRAIEILERLYLDQDRGAFDHPSVGEADTAYLVEHLDWFGRLALHPPLPDGPVPVNRDSFEQERAGVLNEATVTLVVLLAVVIGMGLLLIVGFFGLVVFGCLWLFGQVRVGLERGIAHGGIYAETFALWLVLYGGLLVSSELVLNKMPVLVRGSVAMPLSLLILIWPVLRGVPWSQVRKDIGWTAGRSPMLEPLAGIVCYVINLPIVLIGFITTLVMLTVYTTMVHQAGADAGGGAMPTHPVLEELASPGWPTLVLLFFLLSVVAPIVEETMFRGVLYRQLREVFGIPVIGGLTTAVIVSVIFAAIHPQGPFFVPVLSALALGFCLAREWRGSLIPCMVAHGLNNFLVGLLAVFLLTR